MFLMHEILNKKKHVCQTQKPTNEITKENFLFYLALGQVVYMGLNISWLKK